MKNNLIKYLVSCMLLLVISSCHKDDEPNAPATAMFETIQTNTNEIITDISFYDNEHGVICGSLGYFAKTNDGGKTWTTLNTGVNFSLVSTFMLDLNTYYTARNGIYKTDDGGGTFYEIGNLSSVASSVFTIYFSDNATGFISHNASIKKTTDGGTTWIDKYFVNPNYGVNDLKFTSSNIAYASGGTTFDNFNEGQIVKSTDGGDTWNTILTTINITSSWFINDSIGYYVNVNGELFKTTDGGTSWNLVSVMPDNYIPDILFENENLGYASTYSGKILQTGDGGITWKTVFTKNGSPILKLFKTSHNLFAVGNDGLLIRSK